MKVKKKFMLIGLAVVFSLFTIKAIAHTVSSVEKKAEKITERMEKKLELSKEQKEKVYEINLQMLEKIEVKRDNKGEESRKEIKAEIKKEWIKNLKPVLTNEQFQKFNKKCKK